MLQYLTDNSVRMCCSHKLKCTRESDHKLAVKYQIHSATRALVVFGTGVAVKNLSLSFSFSFSGVSFRFVFAHSSVSFRNPLSTSEELSKTIQLLGQ